MEKVKTNVRSIHAREFISTLALKLKSMKEFEMPSWALYVKTGTSKQRPPENDDWWYVRAASILRKVYVNGIIGTSRLRVKYGSKKNRGSQPEKFFRASGKIIRTILQQATKAGITEHIKEKHAGRRITKKGKEFLENLASDIKDKSK